MNTTLWIVQGLLTFVFLMAGFMKVSRSKDQLASQMAWVEDAPNALERYGRMMAVEDKRAHTFDRVTPQEEGVARVKNIRLMFEKMCDGGLMGSEL